MILRFVINVALALDQAFNTLLLGHPDETLSSRLGRTYGKERYWWCRPVRVSVDWVFLNVFRDPDHCRRSIMPHEQIHMTRDAKYELWSWVAKGENGD